MVLNKYWYFFAFIFLSFIFLLLFFNSKNDYYFSNFEDSCIVDDDCVLFYYSFDQDCCGCTSCCGGVYPFEAVSKENLYSLIKQKEKECKKYDCSPCPMCDYCLLDFKEFNEPFCNEYNQCDFRLNCESACDNMNNYLKEVSSSLDVDEAVNLRYFLAQSQRSVCDCNYCDVLCGACEENSDLCELFLDLNLDCGCF
jgi:hypothetical protein